MGSALFSLASLSLLVVYSHLHVAMQRCFTQIPEEARHELSSTLTYLDIAESVLALTGMAWAIWAFRTESRVAAWPAVFFAILAVLSMFVLM